jgi:GrpB-like predicted nucleotidyltransferase (UPF0157 family)
VSDLVPEHFGSSSVPGLAGKGYLDLQMAVSAERMAWVTEQLVGSGWQRQSGPDAFPPERPMLRAAFEHDGHQYRAHLHLIPADSIELRENRAFRDGLAADAGLRERYVARKRAVLDAGIRDGVSYCEAKSDFVVATLKQLGFRV